jgi:hypothetical protein
MSTSRHPVALRLERQVGGATRLLATVMVLPLVDGIFPALVLAGALAGPFGVVETGLLIFGGSATAAVVLAEMDGSRRERVASILLIGAVVVPAAAVEAALAPTIQSFLDMAVFERFAGLVILAVAARTASAKVGEYLPRPAVIVSLGFVASVQPASVSLVLSTDPLLIAKAAAAAGVGVGFAVAMALAGERLRSAVDLDRFRFGSAVALGTLSLSVLELLPTDAPVALGVLCVAGLFAYDPGGDAAGYGDDPGEDATVADGGDAADERDPELADALGGDEGESRAPWL